MPAEIEEVVANTHETDVQYLTPDSHQHFLDQRAGCRVVFRRFRRLKVEGCERSSVDLSVRRERECIKRYELSGHHMLRQLSTQKATDVGGLKRSRLVENSEGDELLVRAVAAHSYDTLPDRRMRT